MDRYQFVIIPRVSSTLSRSTRLACNDASLGMQ